MRIIDRYLLRHFIRPFLFCLLVFVMLYVVIDLLDNLNEMIENKIDLRFLLPYYLNFIPLIIVQMAPIAVMISIMFSMGTLNRYNEIVAMQASGISLLRILTPLIASGFIISVSIFLINDRVVPQATINASTIKEEKFEAAKRNKKKIEKIYENIAFYGDGNKIIYVRKFNTYNNRIMELIVHNQDANQNVVSKMTARAAEWKKEKWIGEDVMFYNLNPDGRIVGEPMFFEETVLDIEEAPIDFKKRRHQSNFMSFEFMSYAELKEYIKRLSFEKGPTIRGLKVALNQKIAFPFVSLIVIMIASPFALVHTRKGGVLFGIAISVGLVLAYYTVMTVSLAMGKAGFLHPFLCAWLTNIIFAFIGLALIVRHK
ncbi:MAG: LptF/LptG family permease [Candidatus Omnitrophica bacterium]|nr:LptF/LptG family permease [Candidatus Omnitrophota bacterium]